MANQEGGGRAAQETFHKGESALEGGVEGQGFFVADLQVKGQRDDRSGGIGAGGGAGEDQGRAREDRGEEAGEVLGLGPPPVGKGTVFVAPGSGVALSLAVAEDVEVHGERLWVQRGARGRGVG